MRGLVSGGAVAGCPAAGRWLEAAGLGVKPTAVDTGGVRAVKETAAEFRNAPDRARVGCEQWLLV